MTGTSAVPLVYLLSWEGRCTVSAAFDMRAWMRGELPFYDKDEEPVDPPGEYVRYYGVFKTKKGYRSFIAKTRSAIPKDAIEIQRTSADVQQLADELLKRYAEFGEDNAMAATAMNAPDAQWIGRIAVHSDGGRNHTAICVGMHNGECMLLFLTTNRSWNVYARPIAEDEAPFAGFRWNAMTYLAPVLRHPRNLHWRDRYLPTYRVEALREEFFKPERMDLISRL